MTALSDSSFLGKISESENLVIKLSADWCSPCKALAPIFSELADQFEGEVDCATIDIDMNPEASLHFEISSIPALIFFKKGTLVKKLVGAIPRNKLVNEFSELLNA